jgi:AraC-like DNA-binding protein
LPQDIVAATVGYQSASAFSTAFRREVGQARGEYTRASLALTVYGPSAAPAISIRSC